jgi:hypothetical protein
MGDGCCGSSEKKEEKKTESCSTEAKSGDACSTEPKKEEKSGSCCG